MSIDLHILQLVRLKGRVTPADLAEIIGVHGPGVERAVESLLAAEFVEEANGRLKLTKSGKAELAERIAAERADLDEIAIRATYGNFDDFNSAFKQLMTDWQLKRDGSMNDHADAEYDAQIVVRLVKLHEAFLPFTQQAAALAPRLSPYPRRFANALSKVQDGDQSWIARPLADSYHTVWFEFHEDLIGLSGLSRVDEAAAGRA